MTDCTVPVDNRQKPADPGDTDIRFLSRFEDCTLPACEWTHRAHIRLAWICLSLHSFDKALERIREGIIRYNTQVLKRRHKYHETVTVAFATLIASRMTATESWSEFVAGVADLVSSDDPVLLKYYSGQLLNSDVARSQFVAPDRMPLPPVPVP